MGVLIVEVSRYWSISIELIPYSDYTVNHFTLREYLFILAKNRLIFIETFMIIVIFVSSVDRRLQSFRNSFWLHKKKAKSI